MILISKLYKGFYDITESYNEIETKPFEKLSKEASGILLGHVYNKNIDELRYNIGLLESKIKQSSIKKKKVNNVARLKADKVQ